MEQFRTTAGLHHLYRRHLHALATADDVSANRLVLVLANALTLGDHDLVALALHRAEQHGFLNPAGTDDEHILSFVHGVRDPFSLIHYRHTPGGWEVQFNELRALRPKRESLKAIHVVHKEYDEHSFNFNVVPQEAFWSGNWRGQNLGLYYNKFPFEQFHTLVVPEPLAGREQFIEAEDHALVWDLQAYLSREQPKLIIGYNSHGGGESVNHLHFQLAPQGGDLRLFTHDPKDHPLPVAVFTDSAAAWRHIHRLQQTNRPFNAVYAPGRLYVIERAFQGYHQVPAWTTGFAWYELSGGIITVDEPAYKSLGDDQILAVFADMTPPDPLFRG